MALRKIFALWFFAGAHAQQCSFHDGKNNYGSNLKEIKNVTDVQTCCNHCTSTSGCAGYTWVKQYQECWLKSSLGQETDDPAVISGATGATPASGCTNSHWGLAKHSFYNDGSVPAKTFGHPTAVWLTSNQVSGDDDEKNVKKAIASVKTSGKVPLFVFYFIPGRDGGSYSAGGCKDWTCYNHKVTHLASLIKDTKALVVLEPDALSLALPNYAKLSGAIDLLSQHAPCAKVYLDIGIPGWPTDAQKVERLKTAGVHKITGFSLNIAHFAARDSCVAHGNSLSAKLGGGHFVVDTGRNGGVTCGHGVDCGKCWGDPRGARIGHQPKVKPDKKGHPLLDAYAWIKPPGAADGFGGKFRAGSFHKCLVTAPDCGVCSMATSNSSQEVLFV